LHQLGKSSRIIIWSSGLGLLIRIPFCYSCISQELQRHHTQRKEKKLTSGLNLFKLDTN